jgi:hypothetical protein
LIERELKPDATKTERMKDRRQAFQTLFSIREKIFSYIKSGLGESNYFLGRQTFELYSITLTHT